MIHYHGGPITPSRQSLNEAVKPAGFGSWEDYESSLACCTRTTDVVLSYAAHLDKADKVGRWYEEAAERGMGNISFDQAQHRRDLAKALILPDPVDPDLLEAREICAKYWDKEECPSHAENYRSGCYDYDNPIALTVAAIKRGRELAKERSE